jgi:sortase A
LSNGLIAAGIVMLLAVGAYLGWGQLRGAQVRTALRQTPPPGETVVPVPSATPVATATFPPATPTLAPTEPEPLPILPEATPDPAASATPETLVPTATSIRIVVETVTPSPEATPLPTLTPMLGGTPVRIVIPDLKIDASVTEMGWRVVNTADGPRSDWVIPKNEAGHHINSALLGEPGNLVISGHNNIFGQVFRAVSFAWEDDARSRVDDFTDQSDVLNGRVIKLFDASGAEFDYVVEAFYRLKDTGVTSQQRVANGRFMDPTDEAQLTLITCWPPTSNTHRLVVIARPIN